MTFRIDDRVKVSASAIGTGAVPAASAAVAGGFQQLSAIASITSGDQVPYVIVSGSLFECGIGTWNSSTGLARTTVTRNSSGNTSNLNFTGACVVSCDLTTATIQGQMPGTETNDNADVGNAGEYIFANTAKNAFVWTSTTFTDIISLSLSAGDWDVSGVSGLSGSGATVTNFSTWLNTVSVTPPTNGQIMGTEIAAPATPTLVSDVQQSIGPCRFSLSSPQTVYLSGNVTYTGSLSGYGFIRARRVR